MTTRSECLQDFGAFQVWRIGRDRLTEVSRFVFEIYYGRFSRCYGWRGDEFEKILEDDQRYADCSEVYVSQTPDGRILSTMRVIERVHEPLPVERDFDLDLEAIVERYYGFAPRRLFEIGRFAKDPEAIAAAGLREPLAGAVLEALFPPAVRFSADHPWNVWFASVDHVVLDLLRRRHFPFRVCGEPKMYIGSPTVPALMSVEACMAEVRAASPERYAYIFGSVLEAEDAA